MSTAGHYGKTTTGASLPECRAPREGGCPIYRAPPVPVVLYGTDAEHYGKSKEVTRGGPRESFSIVLRAEPGCASPIRSLRALLKTALRLHGLRCVRLEPIASQDVTVGVGG